MRDLVVSWDPLTQRRTNSYVVNTRTVSIAKVWDSADQKFIAIAEISGKPRRRLRKLPNGFSDSAIARAKKSLVVDELIILDSKTKLLATLEKMNQQASAGGVDRYAAVSGSASRNICNECSPALTTAGLTGRGAKGPTNNPDGVSPFRSFWRKSTQ
jgi:hypothetical protein